MTVRREDTAEQCSRCGRPESPTCCASVPARKRYPGGEPGDPTPPTDDNPPGANQLTALLAEIATDDAAWPGPPWESITLVTADGTEWSQCQWRYDPTDRGAGGLVGLGDPGQSAELARYFARLRAREPQLVAALARSVERTVALETALRDLVARVECAGGYASPEEQDVLRRAEQALAGGGG